MASFKFGKLADALKYKYPEQEDPEMQELSDMQSGMLPNQVAGGQGLGMTASEIGKGIVDPFVVTTDKHQDNDSVESNPAITDMMVPAVGKLGSVAGSEAMALGKAAAKKFPQVMADEAGIITVPQDIARVIKGLKANPTKEDVLKALEYNPKDRSIDKQNAYRNLLNTTVRQHMGINDLVGETESAEQKMKNMFDVRKTLYPGTERVPVYVNPSELPENSLAEAGYMTKDGNPLMRATNVVLRDPGDLGVLNHELQHVNDYLTFPADDVYNYRFKPTKNKSEIADRISATNPEVTKKQIMDIFSKVYTKEQNEAFIDKFIPDTYNFQTAGHFSDPHFSNNYELTRATDLLNNNPRILDARGLENNDDIIEYLQRTIDPDEKLTKKEILSLAKKNGFQTLDQLLKKK